jgi:hypothetical protein
MLGRREEKKYSPLNQALIECLPELMLRNLKKGQRLKSKVEVSFLLNNIELRNQAYLKKLVSSSEKTLQNIKSGLDFKKAMELSQGKLSPLNYQILDDYFLRKNNVITNTKRHLGKNTEEESNGIIKSSLHIIKHFLNPTNKIAEEPEVDLPKKKFLSKSELIEAEKVIGNKLIQDENVLNTRVKKYLDRVQKIKLTAPRNDNVYDPKWLKVNRDKNKDFYFYADNVSLNNSDIKMIHYKKLEPIPIRDKSCPNLKEIKEKLFPDIKEGKVDKDNYVNIKNCNSVKIINEMQIKKKFGEKKFLDINGELSDIKINRKKKDSYNTLNRIVIRNKSLSKINNYRYKKLSSLLDIELPKLSDYDLMIHKRKKSLNNSEAIESTDNNKNNELMKKYHKWELMPEINAIKEEIKTLQSQKIDIEQNYLRHKEEIINKTYMIPNIPVRTNAKKEIMELTNSEGLFNLNINLSSNINKINRSSSMSSYETPSIRMPSSYSMNILKRKSRINSGIHTFLKNKAKREFSNNSRERTNVSSIMHSIRNSANTSTTSNKKEKKFNEIIKKLNKIEKKNIFGKPMFSLKSMKMNFIPNSNNNSGVFSSIID